MNKLILTQYFDDTYTSEHPVSFVTDKYTENGNLYIGIICWDEGYPEPWGDLTINVGYECDENCAYIDTNNNGQAVIDWLIENKLGRLTGKIVRRDFCICPEFEFDMDEVNKYLEEL